MQSLINKTHKLVSSILLTIFIFVAVLPSQALAAETFHYEYDNTYVANPTTKKVDVTQTIKIRSESSNYQISKNTNWDFILPLGEIAVQNKQVLSEISNSIKVVDGRGKKINHSVQELTNQIVVSAPIQRDIRPFMSESLTLTYSTPLLYESVGKALNIYIPGLEANTKFEEKDSSSGVTYKTEFDSVVKIPTSLGDPSLVTIAPNTKTTSGNYANYYYDKEDLHGKSIWIQFGRSQIYDFEIRQKTVPLATTDIEKQLGLTNTEYRLILPADSSDTNQKVLYKSFSPKPKEITQTVDGNLLAKFSVAPDFSNDIVVKGYLVIDYTDKKPLDSTGTFGEIPSHLEPLTKAAKYWEVDAPEIQAKAAELKGDSKNVLEVVEKTYDYIVSSIDYDNEFVYGKPRDRKGALKTLQGAESVCMEYSDLFIALSRAQGIPARAAFGQGYDPNVPNDQQEGHQWAQVWIPKIGWISIDTTWGESGRDFIGYDIDHALWLVRQEDPITPAEIEVTSKEALSGLTAPETMFTPIAELTNEDSLLTQDEVVKEYSSGIIGGINLETPISQYLKFLPENEFVTLLLPGLLFVVFISLFFYVGRKLLNRGQKEQMLSVKEAAARDASLATTDTSSKQYELDDPFQETEEVIKAKTVDPKDVSARKEKFNVQGSKVVEKALEDLNSPNKPDTKKK